MMIDAHSHIPGFGLAEGRSLICLIESMDRLGIDRACVSLPIVRGIPSPAEVCEANQRVLDAVTQFPKRLVGYCFVNPGYQRESLAEIGRCVGNHGMIGIKLYTQYRCDDPVVFPVVERAIAWRIPLLLHVSNHTALVRGTAPAEQGTPSHAGNVARLACRYPEADIIEAHIGGGGDWEWAIKTLRASPNVYLDTSGSMVDDGMIDLAALELGVERLLFATDLSMEAGVAKIRAADLTEAQRERVFWQNTEEILSRRTIP